MGNVIKTILRGSSNVRFTDRIVGCATWVSRVLARNSNDRVNISITKYQSFVHVPDVMGTRTQKSYTSGPAILNLTASVEYEQFGPPWSGIH